MLRLVLALLNDHKIKIKINQLNLLKELILTAEEFSQKDQLLHLTPLNNTNYKFSNNNKTKRDMSCKCKKCSRNNSKWLQIKSKDKPK